MANADMQKGSAEMILLALLEERARHGYELAKLIEAQSESQLQFHVASLYPMLYRLERKGLVEGKWVEKAGERRKRYYKLTPAGRKSLAEQRKSLARVRAGLEPAHGVQPCLTGAGWCASGCRRCMCGRNGRAKLSPNWRCNSNRRTRTRWPAGRARRRRCAARWRSWAIGTSWGAESTSPNGARDSLRAGCTICATRCASSGGIPAFTAIATLTLGFGIGGNTAIFTMVDALVLRGLPYPAPERLMAIETRKAQQPEIEPWTSAPDFFDFREQSRAFSSMAAISPVWNVVMTGRGRAEQLDALYVSAAFFPMLGVNAALGRTFAPEEDRKTQPSNVVVLSHGFWQRRFGGSREVLGQSLNLDGGTLHRDRRAAGGLPLCGEPRWRARRRRLRCGFPFRRTRLWDPRGSVRFLESRGAAARGSDGGAGQGRGAAAGGWRSRRNIRNSIAASSGTRVR